jgi:hypothetical protein
MKGMKRWIGVLVSGWVVAGCIEPMESLPGESGMSGVGEARTQALLETPPPVIVLSSTVDLNLLWRGTETARKYVQVVAYTHPPDASGRVPPPRFRAFGLDMSTGGYVFAIDGEVQTELGLFTEKMLGNKAILITTPPGVGYHGSCPSKTPSPLPGRSGVGTLMDGTSDEGTDGGSDEGTDGGDTQPNLCGTEPVTTIPVGGGVGGNDWLFHWGRLRDMARTVNVLLPDSFLPSGHR